MYAWIRAFLMARRAKVVIGGESSSWKASEYGVPQGSPLSPLLFNILIAPALLKLKVQRAMFADDIALYEQSSTVQESSKRLTQALKMVSNWAKRWKVKFNTKKCCTTTLTRCRAVPKPNVKLNGSKLKFKKSPKYLGIHLDKELNWRDHLEELHKKAVKHLEFLAQITSPVCGAAAERVLLIFKLCIRPKLEYACQLWNDASQQNKENLIDSIQHRALARVMGVRRSTSREALEVETATPPLELRREYLTAKTYWWYKKQDTHTSKVLKAHKLGEIEILKSETRSSFFITTNILDVSKTVNLM